MPAGETPNFSFTADSSSNRQPILGLAVGGSRRREDILPTYKANRGLPPDGFSEQLAWVKRLTTALGHGWREQEGLEADDLIASAVLQLSEDETDLLIVSSDKDLSQLVGPKVKQLLPFHGQP